MGKKKKADYERPWYRSAIHKAAPRERQCPIYLPVRQTVLIAAFGTFPGDLEF